MEVILNSEIARLVLGYLKDQNLDKAHRKFCQTSKYLNDEFELLSRGYQPVSISNSNLIEIIKEYCELKSQINQFINLYPSEILGNIQSQPNLIKRLEFVLSKAKCEILRETDVSINKHNATKRKRSVSVTLSTSDTECTDHDSSFVRPAPYYKKSKMFKLHSPNVGYTILSSKDKNNIFTPRNSKNNSYDDTETHAISPTSDLTALKETLLENTEFQNKLADNINKIWNCSDIDNDQYNVDQLNNKGNGNPEQLQFAINNAIDNIITTLEQDPIFDHIVQDVVNHQNIFYDEELEISNGERVECNTNKVTSDRESPDISRSSTPKIDGEISNNAVVDITTAHNSVNATIQPMINDKEVELITERYGTMKDAFVISNEPFSSELLPNLQNFTTNTSHLIITPKSMTTQAQQQSNQSNIIFINDPSFNSTMPLLNLNNTSSNQFPFIMSSSLLNESNVTLPFVMNSSPCVPISTSQFPVNFITQQQTLPMCAPPRRGRPRKLMAPIQQQTTVTSTDTHQYQINKPIMETIKNNTITTRSAVNANRLPVVTSTANILTIVTSSQNLTSNNVIYSQAALKTESKSISNENEIIAEIRSVSEVHPTKIVQSKLEILEKIAESIVSTNDEPIIINVPETLINQINNTEPTELKIRPPQSEMKPIQNETSKITSSNEKNHSATPKQNMKPIDNLKVKSNSTPRRKSHVRILDFTTPGRSEIAPQRVPRTIERSIHLKSTNGSKISELHKFKPKEKPERSHENIQKGITTTPKVKKSTHQCVRVLSRSASEENYEKENEITDSNTEIKKVDNVKPESTTKIGDVKLAANLSPIDEWKQLRNISQTKNWDSYLRFVSAVDNVNKAKIKKAEELARRKTHKLKLMKERKQNKLAVKRLKKPVRKSPRLQKKGKGRILEKSKKLKQPEKVLKDEKEIGTSTNPVEIIAECKVKHEEQISEKVTDTMIVVKEDVLPAEVTHNNAVNVPIIHPHSMASLLETPFKTDIIQSNPITPRFLPPLAVEDTPITKILKSLNKHLGSDLKCDIFTPNFAITPGCNLTPPKSLDIKTPQSGSYCNRPTDYSSGSSYYRPDESDDKIESLATNARNKSSIHEFEYEIISTKTAETNNDQKLVVECPGVLEKVKSFSENSNPLRENVIPHYTFNVPDESVETVEIEDVKETDISNSSSCSCTSSSSSSSSSSSDSSNTSYHPKTEPASTISKIIDENGEIRYPIRTWITPKKIEMLEESSEQNEPSTSTLVSDKQIAHRELEEKRIRMRDKIKIFESNSANIKKPKQTVGNFKSKKHINPRSGVKQPVISSKPLTLSSAVQATEKMKQPRKNPTPKKLIPLKSNKSEPVVKPSNSVSYDEDVNELISVLSDDRVKIVKENPKMSDKVSIKSEDIELAEEFKDAYQNATSESDGDDYDECQIVSQINVLNFIYDEKSSRQTNENQQNVSKDYLLSSKSVMNVNIDGRKIQIKASNLMKLYEYSPNKYNINKSKLNGPKAIEYNQKSKSGKSNPKYSSNRREKYNSQSTKSSKSVQNDKQIINRPLHGKTENEKKLKKEKPLVVVIPESPETTNTSSSNPISATAKAQFNIKYKIPKNQNAGKPVKKAILSRPFGSATALTTGTGQLGNLDTQELNQSFKIPFKLDMKNKLKPSSSDTINAVLAHLHGTE